MPASSKSATRVAALLNTRGRTAALSRAVAEQHALLQRVRQLLPLPVADHCTHARADGKQLVLYTDSPVWSSRLRYLEPELLRRLGSDLPAFTSARVRVCPVEVRRVVHRGCVPLSATSAEAIRELANAVADPELKQALQRLERSAAQQLR